MQNKKVIRYLRSQIKCYNIKSQGNIVYYSRLEINIIEINNELLCVKTAL